MDPSVYANSTTEPIPPKIALPLSPPPIATRIAAAKLPADRTLDTSRSKLIGQGAFATVRSARLVTPQQKKVRVVLKTFPPEPSRLERRSVVQEILAMQAAGTHPNLVSFFGWTEHQDSLCLVLGRCMGGSLASLLGKDETTKMTTTTTTTKTLFSEEQVMSWFCQLLSALHHLHARRILHRDIKSANIFLSKSKLQVKLGDLGVAARLSSSRTHCQTTIGTPYTMSPEAMCHDLYSFPADIWSLGCVLYEAATRRMPFDACGLADLVDKIVSNNWRPLPSHFSAPFRALVASMLRPEPSERPTTAQLLALPYVKRHVDIYELKFRPKKTTDNNHASSSSSVVVMPLSPMRRVRAGMARPATAESSRPRSSRVRASTPLLTAPAQSKPRAWESVVANQQVARDLAQQRFVTMQMAMRMTRQRVRQQGNHHKRAANGGDEEERERRVVVTETLDQEEDLLLMPGFKPRRELERVLETSLERAKELPLCDSRANDSLLLPLRDSRANDSLPLRDSLALSLTWQRGGVIGDEDERLETVEGGEGGEGSEEEELVSQRSVIDEYLASFNGNHDQEDDEQEEGRDDAAPLAPPPPPLPPPSPPPSSSSVDSLLQRLQAVWDSDVDSRWSLLRSLWEMSLEQTLVMNQEDELPTITGFVSMRLVDGRDEESTVPHASSSSSSSPSSSSSSEIDLSPRRHPPLPTPHPEHVGIVELLRSLKELKRRVPQRDEASDPPAPLSTAVATEDSDSEWGDDFDQEEIPEEIVVYNSD